MPERFLIIPPTLAQLVVPTSVWQESRRLLAASGEKGFEATVLWLGDVVSNVVARVDAVYFPHQIAYRTEHGLAVEIPIEEWTDLAFRLPPGRFVLAKLHTHADRAYHSPVDADNPYLCHEGAISITVPDFARDPEIEPGRCSVNVLREGNWIELSSTDIDHTIRIQENVT